MYREYRDLTIPSAVTQCYRDMGARHRARAHSIQIMRVEVIPDDKCRRPNTTQWHLSAVGTATFIIRDDLNTHDLDGMGTGSMSGSHISVALSYSTGDCQVTVLSVHVVGG